MDSDYDEISNCCESWSDDSSEFSSDNWSEYVPSESSNRKSNSISSTSSSVKSYIRKDEIDEMKTELELLKLYQHDILQELKSIKVDNCDKKSYHMWNLCLLSVFLLNISFVLYFYIMSSKINTKDV